MVENSTQLTESFHYTHTTANRSKDIDVGSFSKHKGTNKCMALCIFNGIKDIHFELSV